MSIPDALILNYLELATDFEEDRKAELRKRLEAGENPMQIKKSVAFNVVEQYCGKPSAEAAERFFYNQVQNRDSASKEYSEVPLSSL